MRDWIRSWLRWLDARLIGDGETFPLYRSTDGAAELYQAPRRGDLALVTADFLAKAPALQTFHEERFRMAVWLGAAEERCGDCGLPTFWLQADFLDPADEEWKPLLMLHESKILPMLSVLGDTMQFLMTVDRRV